ncbi:hypothetical protein [Pantoea ananatis]
MNAWNRSKAAYIAECIDALDKQHDTQYSATTMVDMWNSRYKLVSPEQLPALQNQVGLELDAIRGSQTNQVKISNGAIALFGIDAVLGNLVPDFNPKPV